MTRRGSPPSSNGGSTVTGYKVQWKEAADSWDTAADVSEATVTGTTDTITGLTGGVAYAVRVIASNVIGYGPASTEAAGTPSGGVSEQNTESENSAPAGLPTISGTPEAEQTLTADTSAITDGDGLTNVSYGYQWIRNDGNADADIEDATDSTYKLSDTDVGKTIKVKVSFTDDADNQETLTSAATVPVAAAPNREAAGAPTIIGTVQASETLTVDTSKISDVDGIDNAIFEYQWISNDGTTDTDITGGRSSSYIIKPWDLGKYIKVRVSFTDDAGNAETLTSIATAEVEASPNVMPTGAVFLSGMAEVGQALTANADGIHDANGLWYGRFSYQWIRNDGTTDVDIQDATNPGYVLTDADEGKTIKVWVYFTDDGANQETLNSSATTAVTAKPSASDLGEPTALTVGWSQGQEKGVELQWTAPEGTVTSYQILRLEIPTRSAWWEPYDYGCTPLMKVHISDTGGDATTYTDTDVAEGASYTYSVRAINSDGVGRKSSSSRLLQYRPHGYWPAGLPGSPRRTPTNLSSSQIKNGIGLTWDAPEGEVTGYQILRRVPEQCDYGYRVYVENTNSTDTHWADRNVAAGTRYEYHVRSINDVGPGRLDRSISTSIRPTTLVVGPEPNNEATGTPTIIGTAQVGETLTADPSGIADADGMHWARFSYQWLSSRDTEIEGATSPTYTLQASDANKVIKVRVGFMDDSGYEESLTSAATAPVSPNVSAVGAPVITGTVEVGETLTADTSGITDSDGLENVSYRYQWIRSDGTDDWEVDGATGSTYAITAADVDKAIKLRVNFTDDKGSVESLTSPATAVVPVEVSLAFSIEGATVTCDYRNGVAYANGQPPIKECDVISSTDQGASGEIDVAVEIVRSVNSQLYKFDFHIYQMEDSIGKWKSVEANDLCLGPGLADSVTMEVTSDDGNGNFTYTDEGTIFRLCPAGIYQLFVHWYRYNYEDQEYEDAGTFRRFFFINGDDEEDTSIEQVKFITPSYPDTPVSHDAVQIEGTKQSARLNRTLTTFALSIDGLVPDTDTETTDYVVRVQVVGNDADSLRMSGSYGHTVPWCHVGNVGYSYLLKTVPEDGRWEMDAHVLGSCLRHLWPDRLQIELFDGPDLTDYSEPIVLDGSHIISYTGELLYPEYGTHEFIAGKYITIGALSNTDATGAPTITGTAQVDETLTADTSAIADADGLDNVSYAYQWIANDGNSDTEIEDATDSTYTPSVSDVGKTIQVKVNFTDDADNQESLTSEATVAVAATVPTAPLSLTVTPGDQIQELDASWQAPSSNGGSNITGYKVQWKEAVDSWDTAADVSEAVVTGTTNTITSLTGGVEYSVRVIATNIAGDGPASTEARATPADSPTSGEEGTETVESDSTTAWTATLTVGVSGSGSEAVWGYSWFLDGMGTLDERTYNEGDQTIEVMAILLSNGFVAFNVRPHPSVDFVLTVDGTEFASADASEVKSQTLISYVWATTLDWAEDDRVALSLTLKDTDSAEQSEPAENTPATGLPTISGTPQVGQDLTADTSAISDADGLDNVDYSYQWIGSNGNSDTDIENATDSTYTPSVGDVGKTIKVKVSFTDDAENAETLTSQATVAVAATVPSDPQSLTVTSGSQIQELDASWQAPSSNGGSSITGYKVQWKRSADSWDTADDVSQTTVTGTTHTITGLTGGVEYAVRVIATNTAGDGPASAEVTGTPAGATSQQNTEESTSLTVSSIAITSDTGDDDSTWDDDGVYGIGDAIETTVTFSNDVAVTGAPQLELDIGGGARAAEYKSTDGSKIVFSYTVAEGDSDTDGVAVGENKLTLNGGTIKDEDDNAANLAHDALAAQPGHKIDGVRPTISLINLGGSNTVNRYLFISGEVIPVSVMFSEEIIVDGSPQIALDLDSGPRPAHLEYIRLPCPPPDTGYPALSISRNYPETEVLPTSGNYCLTSDTRGLTMIFSYTVIKGDLDTDGLGIAANALSLNGGTIRDTAGNDAVLTHEALADSSAHMIDGVPPEVTSIEIISDPGEHDTYAAGDVIKLNVTFSEEMEILWQYPRLRLDIGDKVRMAYRVRRNVLDISAGETGYIMAFSYTVQDGDNDTDGISIPANAVHRLWGEVTDTNRNDAFLEHEAIAANAEHKVATSTVESTDDTPKTGLLTISGTLRVGEIVTADLSNLTDDDGLDYAADSAHYAWGREGGGLYFEAMRDPRYVIAAADKGKKLRVDLQFFDDNGNKEYRRSAWSEPVGPRAPSNSAPTGLPTITGTPQVDQTLTANTSSIDDGDGLDGVSYSYQWIADGTDINAATGSSYTLTSSDLGKTIQVRVSFADDAENAESLTSTATTAVAAQPTPAVLLTASFANVPADHNGENFTFQLTFSENVDAGYARIRDHAFTVDGATIAKASRQTQGSNQGWHVEVDPTGNEEVSITLPETTDCDDSGAICTDDERMLSHATSVRVAGPPAISVSDASVQEAEGAVLAFSVTLSHASSRTVTVDYATSDGTATAGPDYTASSGSLTFNAGDISQTVEVTVLTDSDEEGQETLTLTLSNASSATLADATGTGAIENGESTVIQDDPPAEDPVVDDPVVLVTATFSNMPATHDGTTFTFELDFSENVKAGYARIRDHAFTINGGDSINRPDITSAVRKEQGSNQGWTITVNPNGAADITITLPETTDCNASGAICTSDGRMLSGPTSATITLAQ